MSEEFSQFSRDFWKKLEEQQQSDMDTFAVKEVNLLERYVFTPQN